MDKYLNNVVEELKITEADEKNNTAVVITYNKSFTARMTKASEQIKGYYAELLINLMSHVGVRKRVSWNYMSFNFKRQQMAKINVRGNVLSLYLALNPEDYKEAKYKLEDVSNKKTYEDVPLLLKIKGGRTFKYAFSLLNDLYEKNNLEDSPYDFDEKEFTYEYLNRPIEVLVKEGLAKEVRRKSKLDRAIKRQEKLLVNAEEELVNVKIYAKIMNPNLKIENLYLTGNLEKLGKWNPKKSLKLEKKSDNYFEIDVMLPKEHLEFKILEEKDFLYVEKGMWKEEIRNHTYDLYDGIVIEDLIYNFRSRD